MSAGDAGALRLGVDLGGTKIAGAALSAEGAIVDSRRVATPSSYDELVGALRDVADALAPNRGTPLGLGIPGSVSPSSGRVRNANLTFVNGRDLQGDVASATGRRVRIANDADCFALSEATDGAARGARVAFGVIVGTGVGGGVTVDGALLPGASGIAGEWGHLPLPWPSPEEAAAAPPCWCGLRGCMEQWVSGRAFARDYAARPGARPGADAPAIVAQVAEGEPAAVAALDAYVSRLGRGLAMVCDLVDPAVIVLGGGMSNVEALYARLPEAIAPFVFTDRPCVRVVRNAHGDASGVRGAAWLWSSPPSPPGRD
jgi:fructokinase